MPPIAFHMSEGCPSCVPPIHPNPWVPLSANDTRKARRAYRAAVTGMDRKLGKLLRELEALKLRQTTAIVLHGDHGWQRASITRSPFLFSPSPPRQRSTHLAL